MTVENDELMQKIIRTGMIFRHIHQGGPAPDCAKRPAKGPKGAGERRSGAPRRQGQGRVLMMVHSNEGISQKELAFSLGIRPQSLSEMLVKLEEDGLVLRKKSEEDARVTNVFLTDAGRERAEAIEAGHKERADAVFAELTDEEKEQLNYLLGKISEGLEKNRPRKKKDAEQS